MSYEERKVRVPDGLDIFLRDYAGERGERGLPVICLHGLTRNSADFEVVAPRIAETGRRVLVLDVRGRGRSERDPKPERYVAPVYAMDVVHIMGALEVERAVFVGTSMGGLMTMIVAATAPGKVAAAVLNDIGPVVNTAGAERIAQYVGKTPPQESWAALTALVKAAQGAAFPNADDVFWERVTRRVGRVLDDGRVAFDYDPAIAKPFEQPVVVAVPDLTPLFLALKETPLLVVHGMLSDILLPEGVAAMRAVKPDIDIVDIPGIGHAPTLEESAAWSAIERFLRRVP